jgi:tetratricopeptide (TPR) repeat protein
MLNLILGDSCCNCNLIESKFDLAIPAALQSLRLSLEVYGDSAMELVPAYLILGEACVGLNQYKQAEDYLSLAKWSIYKCNVADNAIKSKIHRNFGLLYAAQDLLDKALCEFALDIFHSSLANGPEEISGIHISSSDRWLFSDGKDILETTQNRRLNGLL